MIITQTNRKDLIANRKSSIARKPDSERINPKTKVKDIIKNNIVSNSTFEDSKVLNKVVNKNIKENGNNKC